MNGHVSTTMFLVSAQQVTADHGPAVSGAHNTIVTARAGKDLVSALCSGLLTIGPRFGGALDKAAEMFTEVSFAVEQLSRRPLGCNKFTWASYET